MLELVSPPVSATSSSDELREWLRTLAGLEERCRASPGALAMVEWRRGEALGWLGAVPAPPCDAVREPVPAV
jgi:hypothetical protein